MRTLLLWVFLSLTLHGCVNQTEETEPMLHLISNNGYLWQLAEQNHDPFIVSTISGSPVGLELLPDRRLMTILTDSECLGYISHATLQFSCDWTSGGWESATGIAHLGSNMILILTENQQLSLYDFQSRYLLASYPSGIAYPQSLCGITETISGPDDLLLTPETALLISTTGANQVHLYLLSLSNAQGTLNTDYLGDLPPIQSITADVYNQLLIGYNYQNRCLYKIDPVTLDYTCDTLITDPGRITGMGFF